MKAICTKCGIEKPIEDFYKHSTAKLKRQSKCKECSKKYVKEYLANRDKTEPNRYKNTTNQRRGVHIFETEYLIDKEDTKKLNYDETPEILVMTFSMPKGNRKKFIEDLTILCKNNNTRISYEKRM